MSEKRRAEEEIIPAQRYVRIRLASPSPEKSSGSDTESIYSCQGYETELVRDTSDTSSSSAYNIEYEITDTEKHKNKYYLTDDTDDQEDIVELNTGFGAVTDDSVDNALLGDTSEENSTSPTSNSDVDPGLPRNDYLDFEKCLLCQTDKKDISYPYCSTCFTWKKNLFPSRPKKRKKIVRESQTQLLNSRTNSDCSGYHNKNESDNFKNKGSNEENENMINNLSQGLFEDSGVGSSGPQLSEDLVDAPSQEPSTSSSTSTSLNSTKLCRVCFLKPENGLFVHLNNAHVYGCYICAKKIWYHNGGCPICRRKISKVAKLYV